MSMHWAATPFMEAEGNASSQDKNWIITWSNLVEFTAYADTTEMLECLLSNSRHHPAY